MPKKILFLILNFLSSCSLVYGQTLLEKEVTLNKQTAKRKDVLDQIAQRGTFSFTYSNQINVNDKVQIEAGTRTVREWLDHIFGTGKIEYVIHEQKIILKPKSKSGDKQTATIHGHITDSLTGELLIGATVFFPDHANGISSNAYGFYSFTLPKGSQTMSVSFIGYQTLLLPLELDDDRVLDIQLVPSTKELQEVSVTANHTDHIISSSELGTHKLNTEMMSKIPALGGEVDVFRTLQLLPGVKNSGEVSSALSVRGGGLDQNMILLDEAPVYNPSHAIGVFSAFNPDAIKDVHLHKGAIPAEFGGRLSSVIDLRMKDGNAKKITASGGIGTISSRLSIEGPIKKDQTTFQVSGRYTYSDAITQTIKYFRKNNFRFYFYDLNAKVAHTFNSKNKLFLSAYAGEDVNRLGNLSDVKWNNATSTLRWNHVFHDKLFSNTTLLYSQYAYSIRAGYINPITWNSRIEDVALKNDFTLFANASNTIKFGFSSTNHTINPGKVVASASVNPFRLPLFKTWEHGLYVSNEQQLKNKWLVHYGLRYSLFQNTGKNTDYIYSPQHELVDSVEHYKGIYHTYGNWEPRIAVRYSLSESASVKAGYHRTYQYLQMLSNSSLGLSPFDTWYPSNVNMKPQHADQVSIGYFKTISPAIEFSAEVYYKWMYNQIDFADHARLLFNRHIEGELRSGKGYSYGAEFFLKKNHGKLTGWMSYTYARAKRLIPEISAKAFNAPYDQPHNLTTVAQFNFSPRVQLSGTWMFSTGRPITLPTESFSYLGYMVPVYPERNSVRLPNYHRLDLSLIISSRPRPDRRFHHQWVFSVYNAYSRKNPLLIFTSPPFGDFTSVRGNDAYRIAVLPFIPSVTYNFKF